MNMFCADMHVHTIASPDARIYPRELVSTLRKKGFSIVVVTDHDTIKGWKEVSYYSRKNGMIFVRGVELSFRGAHILLYGIGKTGWKRILSLRETGSLEELRDLIKKENGIMAAAHPLLRPKGIGAIGFDRSIFDAVEVFNGGARNFREALRLARGIPGIGGSDAHFREFIGRCWTCFDEMPGSEDDVLEYIRQGKITAGGIPSTTGDMIRRYFYFVVRTPLTRYPLLVKKGIKRIARMLGGR